MLIISFAWLGLIDIIYIAVEREKEQGKVFAKLAK
jgi:hypothetical protein